MTQSPDSARAFGILHDCLGARMPLSVDDFEGIRAAFRYAALLTPA